MTHPHEEQVRAALHPEALEVNYPVEGFGGHIAPIDTVAVDADYRERFERQMLKHFGIGWKEINATGSVRDTM